MLKTFLKIGFFVGGLVVLVGAANFFFAKQIRQAGDMILPVRLKTLAGFYDFGLLPMAAGKQSHLFAVSNNSSEPVAIAKFYTSCRCATANLIVDGKKIRQADFLGGEVGRPAESLAPNQAATVEVIFDPAAEGPAGAGLRESFVYLEDAAGVPLKLEVRALVRL